MKRIHTILAIAALAALGANAQNTSSYDNLRLGIKAAWDLSSASTSLNDPVSVYQNGSGLSLGAFCDIPLADHVYFEPGINFYYNTVIIDPQIATGLDVEENLPLDGSWRNSGFRVPLLFGYRFDLTEDISLAVYTGPQANAGIKLKQYSNFSHKSHSLYGNGWHRFDAQWAFGVRLHYADNWIADIGGAMGMTNLLSGDLAHHEHFRRNTFTIGVGYLF